MATRITKESVERMQAGRSGQGIHMALQDPSYIWDGDALLLAMGDDDLNVSGPAWNVAFANLHGQWPGDKEGAYNRHYAKVNITQEQYDWAAKQAEDLLGAKMGPYAGSMLMSGVPLPEPVFKNAVERAKTRLSTTSTEGLARRIATGQITGQDRRYAVENVGWTQLLGQRGAWPDYRTAYGHMNMPSSARLSEEEARAAWDEIRENARLMPTKDEEPTYDDLKREDPPRALANLLVAGQHSLPVEAWQELLDKKHPVFSNKSWVGQSMAVTGTLDPNDIRKGALRFSPHEVHHQYVLEAAKQHRREYEDQHGGYTHDWRMENDLQGLMLHNQHVKPEFLNDLMDANFQELVAARGGKNRIMAVPGLKDRLVEWAKTHDPGVITDLIDNEVLSPEEAEPLAEQFPVVREHLKGQAGYHWINPDVFAEHKINVAFGTNKMRQARDHILAQGKTELPPKQMPPGDWSKGRLPNGNISAALLQQAIDNAPRIPLNITHDRWEGPQRHSEDESEVFQVNLTGDQVKRLKEAGVFDQFKKMHETSRASGHPLGPTGIGWVRWTGGRGRGIFMDEVQSDFGQSFIRQAANQWREHIGEDEDPEGVAEAERRASEMYGTEDDFEKIKNIVFGGKHPSELLQEAFHEWLRTPHKESKYEMYANDPGLADETMGERKRRESSPQMVDYRGEPIHIWQPESKATISLGMPEEKLPGHFYVGYRDVPNKKMGMKPGSYGELKTQSGRKHLGGAVSRGPVYRAPEGHLHRIQSQPPPGSQLVAMDVDLHPPKATWKDEVRKNEDERLVRPHMTFLEHALPGSLHAEGYRLNIAQAPGYAIATVHRHGKVLGHVQLADWEPKEEWRDGEPYRAGLREAVLRVLEGHAKGKQEEDGWHHVTAGPHLLSKAAWTEDDSWFYNELGEPVSPRCPNCAGSTTVLPFRNTVRCNNCGKHSVIENFDPYEPYAHLTPAAQAQVQREAEEAVTRLVGPPPPPEPKKPHLRLVKAEPGDLKPDVPRGFHAQPEGHQVTAPHPTYAHASQAKPKGVEAPGGKNIWVRPHHEPSNAGRTLMVQFSSDLLQGNRQRDPSDDYYDNLYSKRQGYHRPADWWEVPQWQAHIAHSLPNTDHYTVRDPEEAAAFMKQAGYKNVAFSSLDVTAPFVKKLAAAVPNQHFVVGGYTDMAQYKDHPNVTVHPSVQSFVESEGHQYKPGYDYRHFNGVQVVPRLTLSDGCRHNCTFCCVPKQVTEVPMHVVEQQADAFGKDLNAELVYLNDKTFGQAPNHAQLPALYQRIRAQNPNFKGFVVQTTAAQMKRFTPEFIRDAGIRHIELGIESVNDPILRAHKKPANEALIEEAAQKIRAAGSSLIPNIMVGLPGEDKESYGRTLEWLKRNKDIISHVNAYNLALYEESELGKKLQAVNAADRDENQQVKSWMADPAVHKNFSEKLFQFANEQLNQPVGHVEAGQPLQKAEDPNAPAASSILVYNEHGQVLWGRRQKDGKWTLPGGHLETGEDPANGAVRELFEETGLTPDTIHHFGTANTPHGTPVFMFVTHVYDQEPTSDLDPDNEVTEWRWVDALMGLPPEIRGNLAHEKNVVVEHMGW